MATKMTLAQLGQEVLGAINLLRYDGKEIRVRHRKKDGGTVLFAGGIGSVPVLYRQWAHRVERNIGVQILFPRVGNWANANVLTLDDSLVLFREGIKKALLDGIEVLALAGHSLGGIQAAAMAEEFPEIPWVFTFGSPIWGTPWKPLQVFASNRLGFDVTNPPPKFQEMRKHLSDFGRRIITISSPHDAIAPPESCHIPGATNITLDRRAARQMHHRHVRTVHADCLTHRDVPGLMAAHFHDLDHPLRAHAA